MNPLFSIITITFNAEQVLPPTLDSVKRQSFTNFEHLVVDGASTDGTVEIAERSGIKGISVVSEPDRGLYDAMNKGIRRAKGEYLIFLNAGDAFHAPTSLQEIADAIEQGAQPDIVYGQTQIVNADRNFVAMRHLTAPEHLTFDSFKHGMLVCHQAFAARRDLAPQYNLAYRFSADYDWCIRVLQQSDHNAYVGDAPIVSFLTDGLTDKHHKASLKERYHIMCHYYGTVATTIRHIGFAFRTLVRKVKN